MNDLAKKQTDPLLTASDLPCTGPIGQPCGRMVLLALLGVSVIAAGLLAWTWTVGGEPAVRCIANIGPCTNPMAFFAALGNFFMMVAAFSLFVATGRLNRTNLWDYCLFLGVALLYLSFAREHVHYGDLQDYVDAAAAVAQGDPLPPRYIYPPLWATVLSGIWQVAGDSGVRFFCFAINQCSLVWIAPLLALNLHRCTGRKTTASILVAAALAVNVPMVRNLVYVQINVLVLDLVLLALLLAGRHAVISALCLAVGIHLKLFPILFVPAFLVFPQKGRWLAAVCFWIACFCGILFLLDGPLYFKGLLVNLGGWSPNPFRSASITGFIANSFTLMGLSIKGALLARLLSVPLLVVCGWICWKIRKSEKTKEQTAVSLLGALVFLFPILSPTVWPHHLVLLILPAIIIFSREKSTAEWTVFGFAYATVFVMPVFDWYPWSYLRLIGWVALLVLYARMVPERGGWRYQQRSGENNLTPGSQTV